MYLVCSWPVLRRRWICFSLLWKNFSGRIGVHSGHWARSNRMCLPSLPGQSFADLKGPLGTPLPSWTAPPVTVRDTIREYRGRQKVTRCCGFRARSCSRP